METEWNCPVCHDIQGDMASVTPCLHLFCLGCIVRWAKRKPSCPLCRQAISTIIYSVRSEDDFLEIVLPRPLEPLVPGHQDEQGAAEQVPRIYVAGYPPELWARLFQESTEILEPLLPWLNQELSVLFGARWWDEAMAESTVIAALCRYGLNEEALVREMQPLLRDQTVAFVRHLIDVAANRCGGQILRLMDLLNPRAEEQQDSPPASPGPSASRERTPSPSLAASCSPEVSDVEENTSTLESTLPGGPGCPPATPVPAEQEQTQEELDEAAAVAGPSGQGCSRSPSAPGQDRDCSPREPRRSRKRRASGPQESPQPCKRPSCRRHKKTTLDSKKKI